MATRDIYVALPLDPPTATDYPPVSPPSRSHSPRATIIKKWRSAFARPWEIIDSNAGLLLIAAAQAFLSLVNVSVKKLHSIDPPISTIQLIFARMGTTYACCLVYMLSAGVPDPFLGPKGVRMLLACRGLAGFSGIFGVYYSLQYLSLSDATTLTFLAPLCTTIVGPLPLKEKFSARGVLAGILSLFGVALIARPAFMFGANSQNGTLAGDVVGIVVDKGSSSERLVAVGMALFSVLASTCIYICIRAIGKRAHPIHVISAYSTQFLPRIVEFICGMIATKSPFVIPTRLDWLGLLMLIGIFGFIAQVLLTMGLQRETASRGALAIYTQVIFAVILERIFFDSIPSMLSVCGTLIILTSALYVILTKQEDSNAVMLSQPDEQALEEGLAENSDLAPGEPVLEDKHPILRRSIELCNIRA